MDNFKNVKMVRGIAYYLPRAMKFYNLKNEYLPPVIFLLTLILYSISSYFINSLLPNVMNALNDFISFSASQPTDIEKYSSILRKLINSGFFSLVINIFTNFLVGLFGSVFLITFIKELKGEVYSIKNGFKLLAHKFFKIAFLSLTFSITYNIFKVFFVLPGFIYYSIYLFYMCYALDLKKRIAGAFEASKIITKGHRIEIFSVVILFKVIAFVLIYFITSIALSVMTSILSITSNLWVEIFVSAFMSTMIYLMEIKLVAMIYFDLEYGWEQVDKL